MDEVNEYFLELPEHLRHLVNVGAPRKIKAIKVKTEFQGTTLNFLAGAWPTQPFKLPEYITTSTTDHSHGWSQIFITLLDRESKPFLYFDSKSRDISPDNFESRINHLLEAVSQDIPHGVELIRSLKSKELEADLVLYATHHHSLRGEWIPKESSIQTENFSPFNHQFFSSFLDFCELSDEAILEKIHDELKNEGQEIALSYRWMLMDAEQKATEALCCEIGSWHEIEELCRCLLQVVAYHFTAQNRITSFVHLDINRYLSGIVHKDLKAKEDAIRWQPSFKLWRECIYRYFKSRYFFNNQSIPPHIETWAKRHLQISVNTPTANELLEAQLHLSNWAHKHCTPAEAATLLQFES